MSEISVLMPVYNAANYIAEAINSILNQTFTNFELIIVNDGSTDNSHEIISSFNDSRIKYFQNDGNKGLAFVRNRLIELSGCKYIAFLDSDDIAAKNRLEVEYNFLKSNVHIGIVSSSVKSLDNYGNQNFKSWKFNLNEMQLKTHLLFYNPIVTSTVMFKKEILSNEIFRKEYPPCEDYDLWTRILQKSKGVVLPEILATYRLYDNSVSKRKADESINNKNKVILNQLEYYFINQYTKEEERLHLSLVEFSLKNKSEDLPDLQKWIQKLITLNKQYQHFDEQILKQVLYERMLKKLLRLQNYNFSVFKILLQLKKELQPTLTFELRKKELAIFAFSLARRKFISL
jgi:glycosyltransferase involved in cell wall biosynthesis